MALIPACLPTILGPQPSNSATELMGNRSCEFADLRQDAMPEVLQPVFLEKVLETLQDADLLVFSDFNYGCLPQKLVTKILAEAKNSSVMMAADSQSSSQVGISRVFDAWT